MPLARSSVEPLLYAAAAAATTASGIWLAYAIHPLAPVIALVACGIAVLAMANPLATVLVAIALIPLELVSLTLGGEAGLSPAEIVFVLAGVAWVARRLAAGQAPVVDSPLTKPLAVLLLIALVGFGVAEDGFVTLKIVLMWIAFFFVLQMIVADGDASTVGRILLVLAVTGGVIGLITAVSPGQEQEVAALGTEATGRAAGSFAHPNLLAVFLAAALAAAVAVAVGGRVHVRLLGFGAFAAALTALALTLSRGGLLAAGAAVAVMLLWRPFRRIAGVAAVIGIVTMLVTGGSMLGNSQTVDRVTKRIESVRYAAGGADPRAELWRSTPEIVFDHPLVGVGAGQFPLASSRYGLRDPLTEYQPFDHAHNIPLTVAAELGLLGLAALLWLAVALGAVLVRACRVTSGPERAYAFGVSAALVAIAVQGLVDFTMRSNVLAALALALAGSAAVLARRSEPATAGA